MANDIVAFAYNFPHEKTENGLTDLFLSGIEVSVVIAMDPVELSHESSKLPTKPKGLEYRHPADVSSQLGYRYEVAQHDSERCMEVLNELDPSIGVILGARILPGRVIDQFEKGIINIHPGLLPQNRGLDAMKWAIYNNWKQGVSAHIISEEIDSGRLIEKREVDVFGEDTLVTLNARLARVRRQLLTDAVEALMEHEVEDFPELKDGDYHSTIPPDKEIDLFQKMGPYLCRHSQSDSN